MRSKNKTIKEILSSLVTIVCFFCLSAITCQAANEFRGALKTVTITDSAGSNTPPTASFTYSQNGDFFTFDASGSSDPDGNISEFKWDISNGTTALGMTTTSQLTPGNYEVTLSITDNSGGVAITQSTITYSEGIVIEDGEDGTTIGWEIYDNNPVGATITNEFDSSRQSKVIVLNSNLMDNGFRLKDKNGADFDYADGTFIEFSLNFSESFQIYAVVATSAGTRYLIYNDKNYDGLGRGTSVYFGLGEDSKDGTWQTFKRDLESDLTKAQSGVTINSILSFLVRGSGRIDDVKFR